ncbi:hypothetical protein BGW80DRAFT_1286881, partial [Lactifluus volemus]
MTLITTSRRTKPATALVQTLHSTLVLAHPTFKPCFTGRLAISTLEYIHMRSVSVWCFSCYYTLRLLFLIAMGHTAKSRFGSIILVLFLEEWMSLKVYQKKSL